jgi:hypothetical protein
MEALSELVAAMGVDKPCELKPFHIAKRLDSHRVMNYQEAYNYLENGALLDEIGGHSYFHKVWSQASPDTFDFVDAS